MGNLKKTLNPDTIALIGATAEEGTVGKTLLENLLLSKGKKLFAVNPHRETVLGLTCYPAIADVPEKIDLALVATPPPTVPHIVDECGRAHVEGVIILSSGFKEMGEEGKKLEEQILGHRKTYGMRIIGPDSLGVIRPNIDLDASILRENMDKGNIAFVSQGGALGAAILDWALDAHIGFSMFASLG